MPNIQVEDAVRDTEPLIAAMTAPEKKLYRKTKRTLLKSFATPNAAVRALVDVVAVEVVMYFRNVLEGKGSKHASTIREFLCELDLTPKSKKTSEVSTTLSQVLAQLGGQHGG